MNKRKSISISRKSTPLQEQVAAETVVESLESSEALVVVATPNEAEPQEAPEPASQRGLLGRSIYGAFYYVSFGAVFGAFMVGKVVPGSGLIAQALQDGSDAAKQSFAHFEAQKEQPPLDEEPHPA
jgi:hypothetical protein